MASISLLIQEQYHELTEDYDNCRIDVEEMVYGHNALAKLYCEYYGISIEEFYTFMQKE